MGFNNVYCFFVHYGYDIDGWKEKDEYGFITANSFEEAYLQLKGYFGDDILSYGLEYIGDTGILSINDKALVKTFKKAFTDYHYGAEEEENKEDTE